MFRFTGLVRHAFWRLYKHNGFGVAKAVAYSAILTIFPAFLLLAWLFAATDTTEIFIRQITLAVGKVMPPGSRAAVLQYFDPKRQAFKAVSSAGFVTLFAATGVMISLMDGFRRAYAIENTMGFWRTRARAIYLVLLSFIPMTFATILVAFGNQVELWLQTIAGKFFGPYILFLWTLIRWAIAIVTSIAVMSLIYHHGLPRTQSWKRVLPGAVLATLLWFPATLVFGWYVTNYANYTAIYGSLGAAIALLVWTYMTSLIVLAGAEYNALVYPKLVPEEPVKQHAIV